MEGFHAKSVGLMGFWWVQAWIEYWVCPVYRKLHGIGLSGIIGFNTIGKKGGGYNYVR